MRWLLSSTNIGYLGTMIYDIVPLRFFDGTVLAVRRLKHRQHRLIIPAGNRIFAIRCRWVSESRDFRDRYPRGVAAKQKRRDKNAKYRVICTRLRNCFHEI